jgi:hypothetical protein
MGPLCLLHDGRDSIAATRFAAAQLSAGGDCGQHPPCAKQTRIHHNPALA